MSSRENNRILGTILEVKDIHFKAGDKEILNGVTFSLKEGEICSIIGVNGTGKSTLAAIIMGLEGYKPYKGRILFGGKDITNLSVTERAKLGITLAWQSPASLEGITVKQYLNLTGEDDAKRYLKLVGLNPNRYLDRVLDESLSGGERKRVELASVFSIKPKLVILDEPDSGIDIASIRVIKNVIKTFKRIGASVLLITHNEKMARIGDRALLLCDGRILREGKAEEVSKFFRKHCKVCNHLKE